jgi:outer membrane protein assembly factor BamB
VHGFSQGRDEVRWEQQDVGWTFWEPSPPPYVNSGATFARRTALARSTPGGALAVVRCGGSGGGLRVVRWREGRFDAIFTLPGAELHALSLDLEGRLLARVLHVSESAPPLSAEQARITPFATCPAGIAPGPVAVTKPDAENLPILVVQGNAEANEASGQLVAFHPPATDESSQDLWRIAGRGQSTNWPNTLGPVVADLRGDGGRQLLYSTAAPSGCARFAAMELDGKECWTHDFAEIPGTPPVWNSGGIVLWQAGHFTDPVRQEVLVTVRRSMMHSEETLLLNGSDGRVLWRVARENTDMHSRGVGGTPFAVADFDGDGLDDAASFYPSLFYVLKGTSGANLLLMNAAWDAVPEKPIYWGSAVAGAFESGRKPGAFMAGGDMTALVRGDGTLAWWDALHQSPTQFAFGYFNGDGKTEAMGFGYPDGIRCYDPADGRVQWSMLLPTGCAPTGTASADLNGDGRDEALLTSASMLYCFGASAEGTAGAMLWSILLPAALGPPTVAELEEVTVILCAAQDGFVYCLR